MTYRAKSLRSAKFNLEEQVRRVVDSMPLFTKSVDSKMASRAMELMRYASLNSIKGKVEGIEGMGSEEMATFAKTQKKDSCYDKDLRPPGTLPKKPKTNNHAWVIVMFSVKTPLNFPVIVIIGFPSSG